ncbi:hypothetical protein GOP47_0009853 [Adiantum capillus-veneris]|uniref:Uncharacterized protein n=1 Tax=Adiantum capillus-veneris TaxID=13818 RepID=A0A9D4UYJ2_ADICA|nr:hypothetical protein GOP47_0009853 [Adiantum capillus-veneris]
MALDTILMQTNKIGCQPFIYIYIYISTYHSFSTSVRTEPRPPPTTSTYSPTAPSLPSASRTIASLSSFLPTSPLPLLPPQLNSLCPCCQATHVETALNSASTVVCVHTFPSPSFSLS